MPKYVILNTIKYGSVGDFSHFEDIVNAIKNNQKFKNVELLLLVLLETTESGFYDELAYKNFSDRISALGCKSVFGTLSSHREKITELNKDSDEYHILTTASQVLIISYDKLFDLYEPFFNKSAKIKYISEHDSEINKSKTLNYPNVNKKHSREFLIRGMGLSQYCNGIKVSNLPDLSKEEAKNIIIKSNPELFNSMVKASAAKDLDELLSDNIIIPAYFNYNHVFANFISLISRNKTIHQEKNVIIYHSGTNFNNIGQDLLDEHIVKDILKNNLKCKVMVYSKNSDTPTLEYNGQGTTNLIIRVFSGFDISDSAYQALYKLSSMAGVSGDNTFELAVATKTLPIYWSSNAGVKKQTFKGLLTILNNINHVCAIPDDVIHSFELFFKSCAIKSDDIKEFESVNFMELRDFWPVIADHIRINHNFYDKLESIICEGLQSNFLAESKKNSNSMLGLFGYVSKSENHKPRDSTSSNNDYNKLYRRVYF